MFLLVWNPLLVEWLVNIDLYSEDTSEAYPKPIQTSTTERFAKTVNGF